MRTVRLLLLVIFSLTLIMSCSEDKSTSPSADGTLKILLTDSPGEFEEVNITFSEISVHAGDDTSDTEGEWIIITDETQNFNLLELSNGVTAILGEMDLEEGHYTQIRLEITGAEIVIGDTVHQLTIPSGTIKFVSGFDISGETPTELIVDFDAARSIHTTGKQEEYKLIPTIRLINKAHCGAIIGQVTNYENLPVAYAIADGDTVNTSYVNENNGKFTLGFLTDKTYEVSVSDTLGQKYSNPDVSVIIGIKTDLGDITLE